ncbi:uncharacterized protein LOC119580322 [Penaeus monodon]|uniref:uncharacterized protein LOC119580322 n=1 Tax=Penaeus monodon TaxID=6687 RepID=UPI0018A6F954|nr:uncharacterized protein LOC119580322 [Penaeus monodon]
MEQEVEDLRREVELLRAERADQRGAPRLSVPDSVEGAVRATPVEMVQRNRCVPMFKGKEDELTGGEWITRVESEIERTAIQGDAAKVNFAVSYIHPDQGRAKKIAQMMTSEYISWEEFKKGILAQFSQKKKVWDEYLRDAERYKDESFEEWRNSDKAIEMNFTLLRVWPFPVDMFFSITMRALATTMVGCALDKYKIGEEWDIPKLRTISYSQIMEDFRRWVEKNPEKDLQFQSTLRPRFKTGDTGKVRLATVREEQPRETQKRDPSGQKGSKYFCDVHGWNNTHPKDRCWSLKKRGLPAGGRTKVGQGVQHSRTSKSTGARPKNPAKLKCFLCEEEGHMVINCPLKKSYYASKESKNSSAPSQGDGNEKE